MGSLLTSIIVLGSLLFLAAFVYVVLRSNSDQNEPESYFRIAQLRNGKYRVEEYCDPYSGWSYPRSIGPYIFNTLSEAEKRKNELIKNRKDEMEYGIDKVID